MLGKKAGLGGKLRKLLARIQREFHFPKVFAVRVSLAARVHTVSDPAKAIVHSLPDPHPGVNDYRVDLTPAINTGHVEEPGVHLSQPMSDLKTSAHNVVCYQKETIHVDDVGLAIKRPGVKALTLDQAEPVVVPLSFGVMEPDIRTIALLKAPALLGSRADAARFPYRLRMMPLKTLPMKMQIRYRTKVLKALNLKPTQVVFVGVVMGLPSAPLKLIDVETDTLDGYPRVLAAQTGRFNSFMSGRVWVIIQMKGKPDHLSVIAREE